MPELSPSQVRQISLAGTISCPPQFPDVGVINLQLRAIPEHCEQSHGGHDLIEVVHEVSPRVEISRQFLVEGVFAMFLPKDPKVVDLARGDWYFGQQIKEKLEAARQKNEAVIGILYTPESASTLMRVDVAMTAAESAQYYPPLSGDRSHNHYAFAQNDNEHC
ncbi:MAG: hypothetical protein WDZ51_12140 [Pirellulaceae bacterium]